MSDHTLTAVGLAPRRVPALALSGVSRAPEAGLVALLIAEVVALSVAFDTWRLDAVPSVWAHLVAWSPQGLRLAAAIGAATAVVDGRRLLAALRTAQTTATRARARAIVVHATSIAAFAWMTAILVNGNVVALAHRPAWTLGWACAGAIAVAAWAVALFPPRVWRTAVRPGLREVLLGALIGTAIWASSFVTQELWKPMAPLTFRVVAWLLHALYSQTIVDPAHLAVGTPKFRAIITPACSGYEGVGLIVAFLSIYLWLFRKDLRFPAAFLLLPAGAVTAWTVNALRIVALIAIGSSGWPAVAAGGFHSQAGWIAFNVIAIGFVALTFRFKFFQAIDTHVAAVPHAADSTIPLLAPFVAIAATGLIAGAFSAGFDWLYPLRVIVGATVLWRFRKEYRAIEWSRSWWPIAIGAATCGVWVMLAPAAPPSQSLWSAAERSLPLSWAAIWMASRVLGYILVAPVAEELAFRGFLIRRLHGSDLERLPVGHFSWFSFLASSLLFGALHGRMWVAGTVAGMAFALALYRRRALGDAVLAHVVTNGLLAVYAGTTGHWSVWS